MHMAAEGGSLDVIKYLLPMFRVRVHEKDTNSCTMLHWAAQRGHCQVIRYLIETVNMDPQDRDKVCVGGSGGGGGGGKKGGGGGGREGGILHIIQQFSHPRPIVQLYACSFSTRTQPSTTITQHRGHSLVTINYN